MDTEGHGVSSLTEVVEESRAGVVAVIGSDLHTCTRHGRRFGLVPWPVVPLIVDVSGNNGGFIPREHTLLLQVALHFFVAFVGVPHFRVLVGRGSCGHVVHAKSINRVHSNGLLGGVHGLIDKCSKGFGQVDGDATCRGHASLAIVAVSPIAELIQVGPIEPDVFGLVDVLGDDVRAPLLVGRIHDPQRGVRTIRQHFEGPGAAARAVGEPPVRAHPVRFVTVESRIAHGVRVGVDGTPLGGVDKAFNGVSRHLLPTPRRPGGRDGVSLVGNRGLVAVHPVVELQGVDVVLLGEVVDDPLLVFPAHALRVGVQESETQVAIRVGGHVQGGLALRPVV